jgi:hypothetical protein
MCNFTHQQKMKETVHILYKTKYGNEIGNSEFNLHIHNIRMDCIWKIHGINCGFNAVIFYGINSTVETAWYIFRMLANYRLRHLVNNVAIHIYAHGYIRMEITVLYLKISRHQLSISWSQLSVYWLR